MIEHLARGASAWIALNVKKSFLLIGTMTVKSCWKDKQSTLLVFKLHWLHKNDAPFIEIKSILI